MESEVLPTTPSNTVDGVRQLLQREFIERCRKNPAYSMRGFARFLQVDQSLLSKILRGQRKPSTATIQRIALRLGISPAEANQLHPESKDTFTPLSDDEFQAIADAHHFAILELSKTKSFKNDPQWIAKRLGIHIEKVRDAVERLQRLGLVRLNDGKWTLNSANNTWSNSQTTTEARRLLQKNLGELSVQAIDEVPFDERAHGSLTIAIDKSRMKEFKEKLTEVRRELGAYFSAGTNNEDVYQLTIGLFPLTKDIGAELESI